VVAGVAHAAEQVARRPRWARLLGRQTDDRVGDFVRQLVDHLALCAALDVDVPASPFPRINSTAENRKAARLDQQPS
jgi:hypothetical protein